MGLKLFRNTVEASDFCQNVFIHAYEKRKRFNPQKPLKPWFLKVALNVGRMQFKKKREIPMGDQLPERQSAAQAEKKLLDEERQEMVRQALQSLAPKYRESLLLRFEAGLSLKEMAESLGLSLGTVKSRLNRALSRFKQAYQSKGGEES
jgi:RNA polymerase sigma-70 factor (ECF subfamily)